jgi:hypothetical protein
VVQVLASSIYTWLAAYGDASGFDVVVCSSLVVFYWFGYVALGFYYAAAAMLLMLLCDG